MDSKLLGISWVCVSRAVHKYESGKTGRTREQHLSSTLSSTWGLYTSYSYRFFLNCDSHSRPLRMLLFSRSVMSDSLGPHGLQHIRLPCPSPSPRFGLNSGLLSPWCYPIPSSSIAPFSSCPHSFPASGPFPMSQLFASGGQIVGASALVISHPMNIQGWFPLGLTGLTSLQSRQLIRVCSSTTIWSFNSSVLSLLYIQLTSVQDY